MVLCEMNIQTIGALVSNNECVYSFYFTSFV